jgi:hypothetical protein
VPIHVNNAGVWTVANEVYVNDAGTWREPQEVYVNDAGTWRTVHKVVTVAANVNNLSLYSLAGSPITAITLKVTVNPGVTITNGIFPVSPAIDISSFAAGSYIQLINYGTVYGAGGAGGFGAATGVTEEAGNVDGPGFGGDNPNNPAGGSGGGGNGNNGGGGSAAIRINTNSTLRIENHGTIVGGGGGAGGDGGNNSGGGSGGNGGNALDQILYASVTLDNKSGATFAGGGGGGSGWGNRSAGSTEGGAPGQAGFITSNGGGNFGAQGAAGRVSTANATTIYSGAGVHTL